MLLVLCMQYLHLGSHIFIYWLISVFTAVPILNTSVIVSVARLQNCTKSISAMFNWLIYHFVFRKIRQAQLKSFLNILLNTTVYAQSQPPYCRRSRQPWYDSIHFDSLCIVSFILYLFLNKIIMWHPCLCGNALQVPIIVYKFTLIALVMLASS